MGGNSNGNNGNNIGSSCRLTKKQLNEDATELRRERILELTSQGYSQRQIASMLQISHGTVGNEQTFLRQKAKENIRKYLDEWLPDEYERCMVGINSILRESWTTSQNTEDKREKTHALSLAKECYSMKLDLLTNASVVDDAIRFISQKFKGDLKSSSNKDSEESNEPDYDEDKDQLEEEQEEQTGEITSSSTTTNHIF